MPTSPLLHSQATGIHPSAYVGPTAPPNPYSVAGVSYALPDHVLWVDTSSGPPFALKMWDVASGTWQEIGSTGATVSADCLSWPHGASICNPSIDLVALHTPTSEFAFDTTGITLPGGHRLERRVG